MAPTLKCIHRKIPDVATEDLSSITLVPTTGGLWKRSRSVRTTAARASTNGITATTTKSSKGKGKAVSPSPTSKVRSSRFTSQAQTQMRAHIGTEPITIDSDDEDLASSLAGGSSAMTTNWLGKEKGKKLGGGGRKSKRKSNGGVGEGSMGAGGM
ncbi:hypothetical protein PILCRDRAFT_13826 [Piloderma croceum F 1598]|uniref:Uncharacterized protein n=1 Tax=Piloderma croceum (strain F 1598) TaxID=765440 RepID=A0A0C3F565_PILCF|nr:hypothetical protein PILCRDRAFT_13826 [Piloderma croceum F 1598]